MAENRDNGIVRDADEENSITLDDFLEEQQRLQSDANAVLGSTDDKNCTYNLGYVHRQPLYACVSCAPQNDPSAKPAGICLACSYHCHEGHELVELYTKRFFRCDCGNIKFRGKKCNLEANKTEENENNVYNQNFKGLYCTCARPFPDPEDDVPDMMIQCIVCEDWYHTRHLHTELPTEGDYYEMICGLCTDRLSFLKHYLGLAVTVATGVKNESADNSSMEVTVDENTTLPNENVTNSFVPPTDKAKEEHVVVSGNTLANKDEVPLAGNSDDKNVLVNGSSSSKTETHDEHKDECKLQVMKHEVSRPPGSATFWHNFRSSLCACTSCKRLYSDLKVPWILDESDTVQSYEEKGKQNAETNANNHEEEVLQQLAKLDRFRQVEVIQTYNDFKRNLSEFLGKFAQEKKVVKKEDVDEFFDDMQKKRQKLGTPPYSCR